jgi:TonB family protein
MDAKIFKSSGNPMLDESALAAARKAKFTPAKQRDIFVRVRVNIPFEFKLQ